MSQCAFNGPLARYGVAVSTPGAGTTFLTPTSATVQRVTQTAPCTFLLPQTSPEIAGLEFWIITASLVVGDVLTIAQNDGAGAPQVGGMAAQEQGAAYANITGVDMTPDNAANGKVSLFVCTGAESDSPLGAWVQVVNFNYVNA